MDLTRHPRWAPLFRQKLVAVPPKRLTGFEGTRWRGVIPVLRKGYFYVSVDRSVGGDAPKDFIHVYQYRSGRRADPRTWPGYIAKIGHKWYPAESVTEQLLTRIGESLKLRMAESLLMNVEGQIRFLSRYFLKDGESLVHGAEIIAGYVEDDQFVQDVGAQALEKDIFTFEVLSQAIATRFPNEKDSILMDFVRMLGYDALVGNQDRHLYNWGVVVHVQGRRPPTFSPIYDTARGLFWNQSEDGLVRFQSQGALEKYVNAGQPLIGCDREANTNHFRLVANVAAHNSQYAKALEDLLNQVDLTEVAEVLSSEFTRLFSNLRRSVIIRCLQLRVDRFAAALNERSRC